MIPYLFLHLSGRHIEQRIQDFRKVRDIACWKARCPGMLRHDIRCTAVRNLVNAGVPERVAMKITGHKTRAVFDRYHIVSPADLQEAARKLTGTFSGTLPEIPKTSKPQAVDFHGRDGRSRTAGLLRVKQALSP